MREHSTPEKECLQRIADIAVGYDGNADANCEHGSMKGLCGLIDEMKEYALNGLSGKWPEETGRAEQKYAPALPFERIREIHTDWLVTEGEYSGWHHVLVQFGNLPDYLTDCYAIKLRNMYLVVHDDGLCGPYVYCFKIS